MYTKMCSNQPVGILLYFELIILCKRQAWRLQVSRRTRLEDFSALEFVQTLNKPVVPFCHKHFQYHFLVKQSSTFIQFSQMILNVRICNLCLSIIISYSISSLFQELLSSLARPCPLLNFPSILHSNIFLFIG